MRLAATAVTPAAAATPPGGTRISAELFVYQLAQLDREIAGDLLVLEHVRLLGCFAHLLDRD
jgi:hypothetical protein